MKLETLEKKLEALKLSTPKDREVFIRIKDFENYEISNFGRVKSLAKPVFRLRPRGGLNGVYIYKAKFLAPLFTGKNRKWVQVRLTTEKNVWRQLSLPKLMISSFLNISIDKLPHGLYCLDHNSRNINLHNLTFIRNKIGR